jgi:hypothetical protein
MFKALVCSTCLLALTAPPLRAGVEVRADRVFLKDGYAWLHMALWNCTRQSMTMSGGDVPWAPHGLTLGLYRATQLPAEGWSPPVLVEDAPPQKVTIGPGRHLEGDAPLHFGVLIKGRDKGPFVLFWSYNTGRAGESPARQLSGVVNIGIADRPAPANRSPCAA